MFLSGNHRGLWKKWCWRKSHLGCFLLWQEVQGKRRKNTCSTTRRRDLRGFTPHIDWIGFLKFDLIKIGFLKQPAAACLLPHIYTKAIQSGLSSCSIFPCFVLFLTLCLPPVLRTAPAQPCHFRLISPSGFQTLVIFQVSVDEMSGQIIFSWSQYPFHYLFSLGFWKVLVLLKKMETAGPCCTHSPVYSDLSFGVG